MKMDARELTKVRSIRTALVRSQLFTGLLVLIACSAAFISNDLTFFRRGLSENVGSTARILGSNLAPAILFADPKQATKVLGSLRAEPSIVAARVYDTHGAEFARYGDEQLTVPAVPAELTVANATHFEGNHFWMFHRIVRDDEFVGTLYLGSTLSALKEEYRRYAFIVLSVLISGLLISLALSAAMQKAIAKPVVSLLNVIQRVSESGDYSLRVGAEVSGQHISEIARLSEEFDKMLERVQHANDTLERRVEERAAQLKEAQKLIVQSSRMSALGEMAGGIAHEINNPLGIIHGRAGQLLHAAGAQPPDIPKVLQLGEGIRATSMRISKIIKGLRAFSRDGSQDPFEDAPLKAILDDALELCQSRLKNHGITLRVGEVSPDLKLECRPTQIGQVLLNLLNNADDAILTLPEPWIEIIVVDSGDRIRISITDCGPGIPEEVRKKLMQPFFTTKEVGKGTGLGLSISRGIILNHSGTLEIDASCPNTRFVFDLPKRQTMIHTILNSNSFEADPTPG